MTLDELLLEWSYRSEKGYPNLDSPSDVSILKEILQKLDLPTYNIIQQLREQNDEVTVTTDDEVEDEDRVEEGGQAHRPAVLGDVFGQDIHRRVHGMYSVRIYISRGRTIGQETR